MTKRSYSFYDHVPGGKRGDPRALPELLQGNNNGARLSAGTAPFPASEEEAATRRAEEILERLSSHIGREISKKSATPFTTLYGVFCEFFRNTPSVNILPIDPQERFPTVAVCIHNLFFCLAGIIRSATRRSAQITVGAQLKGDGAAFRLSLSESALLDKEVEELFGLSPTERMLIQKIAEASFFSFRFLPGDNASILFALPRYRAETFMVYSADRLHSLRLAAELAEQYFG